MLREFVFLSFLYKIMGFYNLCVIQFKAIIDNNITIKRGLSDSNLPNRNITVGQPLATNAIACGVLLPGF